MKVRQRGGGKEMPHCRSPEGGSLDAATGSQEVDGARLAAPRGHGNAPEQGKIERQNFRNLQKHSDITAYII